MKQWVYQQLRLPGAVVVQEDILHLTTPRSLSRLHNGGALAGCLQHHPVQKPAQLQTTPFYHNRGCQNSHPKRCGGLISVWHVRTPGKCNYFTATGSNSMP